MTIKYIISHSGSRYSLKMTCVASPEQYDVYLDNTQVAYFRLRSGCFTAECPDSGKETVYEAYTTGFGAFDESEEHFQLNSAIEAVDRWLASNR